IRPFFDDGPPLQWTDDTGQPHAACVFQPAAASPSSKLPLVLYLPGTSQSASGVYDDTSLRSEGTFFDFAGDGPDTGFTLASAQERNLQNPFPSFSGAQFDYQYRDLGSPSCNPDVNGLDGLIDQLVSAGNVDADRIYLMGWSAGATFAQLYAVARHDVATPGGNRVAAASVYAGFDPFNNLIDGQSPSCQLDPYPATTVPMQMVHRACDSLVNCNAGQHAEFGTPPGDDVEAWLDVMASTMGDSHLDDIIIDLVGDEV